MSFARRVGALVVLGLAAITIPTNPAQAQGCPPGSEQAREEREGKVTRVYCRCVAGRVAVEGKCELKETALQDVSRKLQEVEVRLARTRKDIQAHSARLPQLEADLQEWADLPLKARAAAHAAALETAAAVALERLGSGKGVPVYGLSAKVSGPYWERLRELRFPDLVRRQKELYDARTDVEWITALTTFRNAIGAHGAMLDHHGREMALTLVLKGIDAVNAVAIRHPTISLLIANGELVIADLYAWKAGAIGRERVEQLLELSEQQLTGLQALTTQYKKDVDRRRQLLAERERIAAR